LARLREVDGMIMAVRDREIIGCVCRCNESQWEFVPLRSVEGGSKYVRLQDALQAAVKYDPPF
jgi:hypothetical protein